MMADQEMNYILPAEFVGKAAHDDDGVLRFGEGDHVVELHLTKGSFPGWWADGTVGVYVRRFSRDLSIAEIHIACHDGLGQEELDEENRHAGPDAWFRHLDDWASQLGLSVRRAGEGFSVVDGARGVEVRLFMDLDDVDDFLTETSRRLFQERMAAVEGVGECPGCGAVGTIQFVDLDMARCLGGCLKKLRWDPEVSGWVDPTDEETW